MITEVMGEGQIHTVNLTAIPIAYLCLRSCFSRFGLEIYKMHCMISFNIRLSGLGAHCFTVRHVFSYSNVNIYIMNK